LGVSDERDSTIDCRDQGLHFLAENVITLMGTGTAVSGIGKVIAERSGPDYGKSDFPKTDNLGITIIIGHKRGTQTQYGCGSEKFCFIHKLNDALVSLILRVY
jgi:hypothetical protein